MKQEMRIVILSAVLAFLGSTVGAFLSFQLGEKAWEREVQYDHKKFTVQQRIKLVERLAKAVASLDEIQKNIELIKIDRFTILFLLILTNAEPIKIHFLYFFASFLIPITYMSCSI